MADWLYPYSEVQNHGPVEGGALKYFSRPPAESTFYLTTAYKQIQVGDTVWVYGSEPYRRVIGVGTVIREPELTTRNGDWTHWFGIAWNAKGSRRLAGASPEGLVLGPLRNVRAIRPPQLRKLKAALGENYVSVATAAGRLTRTATTTYRPAQPAFREAVIRAYEERCAITGCSDAEALEAAHILPHNGRSTDVVTNGLLLRADLHRLFDRYLIGVDSEMKVVIHPNVTDPAYRRMNGQSIRLPVSRAAQPRKAALREHLRLVRNKTK